MNRKFFIKVSIIAIVALGLLALVQCVWVVKMYTDQIGDFQRRVESAAYKSIYKAFRMDAIPGLQVAEQINMDLDEFALHFEPNLLELDIKEPYTAEILEMTSGEGRTLMLHSSREPLGEKVHTCTIPVDDDGMFALRLTIRLPYGQFWGNMWGLLDVKEKSYIEDLYITTPDLTTLKIKPTLHNASGCIVLVELLKGERQLVRKAFTASGVITIDCPMVKPWDTEHPVL